MKQFMRRLVTKKKNRLAMCSLLVVSTLVLAAVLEVRAVPTEAVVCTALTGLTVAVDPGHGGYDGGARAHDSGVWEKELTLQIARALEKELSARGASVLLTRTEDVSLSEEGSGKARKRADLQKRLDLARQAGADVFLSIHLNEYRSRLESGPQVFYQRGADAGRLLAGALQESLVKALQPERVRKANAGDYYVLRECELPSALVECGFLSHAEEEKKLLTDAYQQRIARAIADGLENWRNLWANSR